jgi:2-polyprenyl-3-methyl-5-hydroxy-6-metoxy-1,4-benzoquinol methylase
MHAIALVKQGCRAVGADLSVGMIERARANARAEEVKARFEAAGFGELAVQAGTGFDAVLCLGNSLPHFLAPADL